MPPPYDELAVFFINVVNEVGSPLMPGMRVLDFGCGSGELAALFSRLGFKAYGADIQQYWTDKDAIENNTVLMVIGQDPYRLPFDDNFFDLIISNAVFEHVMDYEACFKEIHRVLKKGGQALHVFPGPWVLPVETHTLVPFASMISAKWWLAIWALCGIRNQFQRGMSLRQVIETNYHYCRTSINYLPRKKVRNMLYGIFGNVLYPKKAYIKYAPGNAARLGRMFPLPGLGSLIFSCRQQVVFMKKFDSMC